MDNLAATVDAKLEELKSANETLNKKVTELEKRLDMQETHRRRKNIILFGAPDNTNVYDYLRNLFTEKLKISVSIMDTIEKAYRFGKADSKRPIAIQFISERKKIEVMRQAHLLKGTKIQFSDDLTLEERKQRKIVVAAQKEAKKLSINAKIRHNGLLIGKDLVDYTVLSRAGWAAKYKENPLRRSRESSDDEQPPAQSGKNSNSKDKNSKGNNAPHSKKNKTESSSC